MAEAALSAWSNVEEFLRSRYPEEIAARIAEVARQEGLDATLIDRVIATGEREEVKFLH
jgi:hypothetical protein